MHAPMPSYYVAALLAVCCALTVPMADAGCQINLDGNRPVVLKDMGTRRVQLRNDLSALQLGSNETVTTLCMQHTRLTMRYSSIITDLNYPWSMTWHCIDDTLSCSISDVDDELRKYAKTQIWVSCATELKRSVYVSNVPLQNCGQDTTLLIGVDLTTDGPTAWQANRKTLALCYDLSRLVVRYISYVAYSQRNVLDERVYAFNELEALRFDEMLFDFMNYFDMMSESQFSDRQTQLETQLPSAVYSKDDFELAGLLQDAPLHTELSDFETLLHIVWLKPLLHGNWQHFLQALLERSDDVKYEVRLGTSDVIALPSVLEYNKTQPLMFRAGKATMAAAPKYVWAHLRTLHTLDTVSTPANTDDFVIVAINTPYLALAPAPTLCKDICDTIPWLRESVFGKLHLLPHYGVVHCCHTWDVGPKLTGFPLNHSSPHTPRTHDDTTEQPTTTTHILQPYQYSNENMINTGSGEGDYSDDDEFASSEFAEE